MIRSFKDLVRPRQNWYFRFALLSCFKKNPFLISGADKLHSVPCYRVLKKNPFLISGADKLHSEHSHISICKAFLGPCILILSTWPFLLISINIFLVEFLLSCRGVIGIMVNGTHVRFRFPTWVPSSEWTRTSN
jgi:hypothetical protein